MKYHLIFVVSFYSIKAYRNLMLSKLCFLRRQTYFSCKTYCPDPSLPHPQSLRTFDDSKHYYPPLIHHITSTIVAENIFDMIAREVSISVSQNYLKELILFGSVYLLPFETIINPGKKKSPKPFRCDMHRASLPMPAQSYCRIHMNPRRYMDVYLYDWSSRILHLSDAIVVLDKPSGVPTSMTVDNAVENAMHQMTLILHNRSGTTPSLHTTSRLDVCASGVLLFARSPQAASLINKEISQRRVHKIYRVLCHANSADPIKPPPTGIIRHLFKRPRPSTGFMEISRSQYSSSTSLSDSDDHQLSPDADMIGFRSHSLTLSPEISWEDKVRSYDESLLTGDGGEWQVAELVVTDVRRVRCKGGKSLAELDKGMFRDRTQTTTPDSRTPNEYLYDCSIRLVTVRAQLMQCMLSDLSYPLSSRLISCDILILS